ncbi:MAG: glycosyltransferase family 1 protein [Planctomycetota bacterium]|nr:glycosyltransferase family 1 protein [Planctomycetota bacterium]MDA1140938.1 glycosyltransferase family 1 protein [Planctomycetota bacterium]
MKVIIDGLLLTDNDSGVQRCIRGLIQGLDQLSTDDEFEFITGYGYDDQGWTPERLKHHRAKIPCRVRSARIFYDQFCLPIVAGQKGADLIHGPGYIIPGFTRIPAVVTVYDIIALKYPQLCKRSNVMHFKWNLPRSIQKAAAIIVLSNAVKQDLVTLLKVSPTKIEVIPPGIDKCFCVPDEETKRQVRERYELPDKFVLFVGNIEPKKNLETLIKVFFAVKMDKKLDHKLVIVGQKGWKYKEVFALIDSLDVRDQIIFTDYVPLVDLPAVYALADCFAFPSLVEGFGIPPLEAMACGTPVMTSEDPAILEATGDAALHAPATDAKAMRKILEKLLLNGGERRRLKEAGLNHAAKFTWKKSAERTVELYRKIVGERGRTE